MKKIANYYRRYGHVLYLTLLITYALFTTITMAARLGELWAAVVMFIGGLMIPGVLTVKFFHALDTSYLARTVQDIENKKENQ
nr:MAG TPA: hypothetical protein [Caudoviricetes sp.]